MPAAIAAAGGRKLSKRVPDEVFPVGGNAQQIWRSGAACSHFIFALVIACLGPPGAIHCPSIWSRVNAVPERELTVPATL